MEIKAKKCKGTGNAIGYGCGTIIKFRKFGLCDVCRRDWLLNDERGKIYIQKATLKAKKPRLEREKIKKELTQKSISSLVHDARRYFQLFIRLRDEHLPCISCGNHYASGYDGGHYYKAELYTGLIFNEINVNKQCEKCNRYQGGNESGYRLGLIQKYGVDVVNDLDKLSKINRSYKFSRQELQEIKEKYQRKVKELKK